MPVQTDVNQAALFNTVIQNPIASTEHVTYFFGLNGVQIGALFAGIIIFLLFLFVAAFFFGLYKKGKNLF